MRTSKLNCFNEDQDWTNDEIRTIPQQFVIPLQAPLMTQVNLTWRGGTTFISDLEMIMTAAIEFRKSLTWSLPDVLVFFILMDRDKRCILCRRSREGVGRQETWIKQMTNVILHQEIICHLVYICISELD